MRLFSLVMCSVVLLHFSEAASIKDDEACNYVPDNCPVWKGWSTPKCHVDDNNVNCVNGVCSKWACTYCAAKSFGCATTLQGGVNG